MTTNAVTEAVANALTEAVANALTDPPVEGLKSLLPTKPTTAARKRQAAARKTAKAQAEAPKTNSDIVGDALSEPISEDILRVLFPAADATWQQVQDWVWEINRIAKQWSKDGKPGAEPIELVAYKLWKQEGNSVNAAKKNTTKKTGGAPKSGKTVATLEQVEAIFNDLRTSHEGYFPQAVIKAELKKQNLAFGKKHDAKMRDLVATLPKAEKAPKAEKPKAEKAPKATVTKISEATKAQAKATADRKAGRVSKAGAVNAGDKRSAARTAKVASKDVTPLPKQPRKSRAKTVTA